ncbi:putative bifunctional diguanylate cyclase/phosphodiesterase [Nocardia rhizosphaerae]|uniref:Bifunctional diguanylate cyclase/phosphodiesterase n=1 Tax=Nocardia rhizosphaerae TaxID=1691571 RepID=A0ABV8LAB1_9NOCA
MSGTEARLLLTRLGRELLAAVTVEPPALARVERVGAELARAHFVGEEVLGRSLDVLGARFASMGVPVSRMTAALGAFANGYLRAFRSWLLSEQESVRAADMAARAAIERRLRASEARMRGVFAQAGVGTGLSDMTGRIIEVNAAFAEMLGYRPEEMYALSVTDLAHPDDDPGMWELYGAVMRGECDSVRLEKAYPHRDGHTVWTNLNVSLIRDEHGAPQYTLVLVEDISEQRALQERLRYRAHHDQLTGLANRSRFFDALSAAFADHTSGVGLCYVDLDHFKTVNDSFGHAVGDELLTLAADRLQGCLTRPGQLVARMGGDEFVVLIPDPVDQGEVARIADAVLAAFAEPFEINGHRMRVGASVGVMAERADRASADEFLQAADTSMYWAKAAGRGRWAEFDPARGRREHVRAELSAAIPEALSGGQFFLHYQPIVELAGGRIGAVEALVRWQHPELGLSPAEFIDLAEDDGHIGALGAYVLEQACRAARRWFDRNPDQAPVISVNVSATEVADPAWLTRVLRILAATGLPADRLQLELTERVFMAADDGPLTALRTLAAAGVRIALDDFGTGYSNLAYLGRLPLRVVKLAGPFIEGIELCESVSATDIVVLETIIGLAHTLGLTVTAECVETPFQAEQLRALRCDSAQGWHFHRPMPEERASALLEQATPADPR